MTLEQIIKNRYESAKNEVDVLSIIRLRHSFSLNYFAIPSFHLEKIDIFISELCKSYLLPVGNIHAVPHVQEINYTMIYWLSIYYSAL